MSLKPLLITCVIAVVLSGCAKEYSYKPPTTASGQQCVQKCQDRQDACRARAYTAAEQEQKVCEANAPARYKACLITATKDYETCETEASADYIGCLKYSDERSKCKRRECSKNNCYQHGCPIKPNYGYCASEFRACFEQCGGRVEER